MGKQLTVRNVPDPIAERLETMSRERDQSVNKTVLEILAGAVGDLGRREHLRRYVTWTDEDCETFDGALRAQRRIDDELWS